MTFCLRSLDASLLACAISLFCCSANAEPAAGDLTAARRAFQRAVNLESSQKWAEASVELEAALAIKDTPGLRFHLAHCQEQQGLLLEAGRDYDRAAQLLEHGAHAPDVDKLLGPASSALKQRIPRVTVELPVDLNRIVAELDGKIYAPSDLALGLPLNPGRHALKISANDRTPFESSFSLTEGEQLSVHAELARVRGAPVDLAQRSAVTPTLQSKHVAAPSLATKDGQVGGSSAEPYLLIGEGVIALGGIALGIGYKLSEFSARDRVRSAQSKIDGSQPTSAGACTTPASSLDSTCADLRTAIGDHDRDSTLSTVGFVCGGVGAAALLATLLLYPSATTDRARQPIAPTVGLGQIGLVGHF
jgi:hypothetical protein